MEVHLNEAGIRELLNSDGVMADLKRRAGRVLDAATQSAPVVSGDYRASLQVVPQHTDRARVQVVATAPYAMEVEATHGVLARALDSAGGE